MGSFLTQDVVFFLWCLSNRFFKLLIVPIEWVERERILERLIK